MVIAIVYLVLGAAILVTGARAVSRTARRFALERGFSPVLVGTLFFGANLGSLAAVLVAAGRGQTTIAVGAALGTALIVSVGFGFALLVAPRPVSSLGRPTVLLPAGALVLGAAALANEQVTRLEGGALVFAYAAYLALAGQEARVVAVRRDHVQASDPPRRSIRPEGVVLFGVALCYLGAMVLVGGGSRLVARTGLTAGFVGAAIVGALASIDEALLVVTSLRRPARELAVGNVLGTFAAIPTGIMGLAALVRPLTADPAAASAFLAVAALYTLIATVFLARDSAWKRTGLAFLVLSGLWVAIASRL